MQTLAKWARIPPEHRAAYAAECVRLYVEGRLSLREVAAQTGRSYGTVHATLLAQGVTLRPRGNPGHRGHVDR